MSTPTPALAHLAEQLGRPAARLTLGESVAAGLELRILRGEFAQGERLPTEDALAETLGVSRSVVRDAIRTVAARGLITVRQGQGITVSLPSDAAFGQALLALLMRSDLTMADVIDARAALETELSPLAARNGSGEDWDRMEEHLHAFADAVTARDWGRAHEQHMAFHVGLFKALRTPALELLLRPVQQYIFLTSVPPVPNDPDVWEVDSHPPILAALRAGDEPAVRIAMHEHFQFVSKPEYVHFRKTLFRTAAALEPLRMFRPSVENVKDESESEPSAEQELRGNS